MRFAQAFYRVSFVALLLLGVAQPAWALGDFIIPQLAGMLVGGPVLVGLLIALIVEAKNGNKADLELQKQWGGVAIWGVLFNGLWFGLLQIFDPRTWHTLDRWTEMGFALRYVLPSAILAAYVGFSGRKYRALALMASCLLVGVGYSLFVALPNEHEYKVAREKEQAIQKAAEPDGSREKPYQEVFQTPRFEGGPEAQEAAIQREINYPREALTQKAEREVQVDYTVLPNGSLTDVRATGCFGDIYCDEAERVVKCLPPFVPGRLIQDGMPVAVTGTLRVAFKHRLNVTQEPKQDTSWDSTGKVGHEVSIW